MYFLDKCHPLASTNGRVWYHRHVASIKLGRWLHSHEVVHHVDGDRANNDPDNLVVITRSKHAVDHAVAAGLKTMTLKECELCGKKFKTIHARFCSTVCEKKSRRQFDPTKNELRRLVWELPTVEVARRFGVSDTAVAKRCKLLGVDKPSRGYWTSRKVP
jgi:hypothetical protein